MFAPATPELPAAASAKAESVLTLSAHALGTPLEISCTGMTSEGGLLEAEGKSSGKLAFSGCAVSNGKEVLPACEPKAGTEKGTIRTKALKGTIVLNGTEPLEQIAPVEGSTLATSEGTSECSFGTKIPVLGTFYAKDTEGKFEVEQLTHRFVEGPLTELWAISKTIEHKASISGTASASLSAPYSSTGWSGLPS